MSFLAIDQGLCLKDGICAEICPLRLIRISGDDFPAAIPEAAERCIHCGHCQAFCPTGALVRLGLPPESLPPIRKNLSVPGEAAVQLLRSPRSIRHYTDAPVSRDLIARLIDVTRHAPTAHNAQPVRWLVIDDRKVLHELAGGVAKALREQDLYVAMADAFDKGHEVILRGAPALLIAQADPHGFVPIVDCTIALTTLSVAAFAHGLGCCWAGLLMATAEHPDVAKLLDLPPPGRLYGALMLGHPRYAPKRLPPRNPAQITWRP